MTTIDPSVAWIVCVFLCVSEMVVVVVVEAEEGGGGGSGGVAVPNICH